MMRKVLIAFTLIVALLAFTACDWLLEIVTETETETENGVTDNGGTDETGENGVTDNGGTDETGENGDNGDELQLSSQPHIESFLEPVIDTFEFLFGFTELIFDADDVLSINNETNTFTGNFVDYQLDYGLGSDDIRVTGFISGTVTGEGEAQKPASFSTNDLTIAFTTAATEGDLLYLLDYAGEVLTYTFTGRLDAPGESTDYIIFTGTQISFIYPWGIAGSEDRGLDEFGYAAEGTIEYNGQTYDTADVLSIMSSAFVMQGLLGDLLMNNILDYIHDAFAPIVGIEITETQTEDILEVVFDYPLGDLSVLTGSVLVIVVEKEGEFSLTINGGLTISHIPHFTEINFTDAFVSWTTLPVREAAGEGDLEYPGPEALSGYMGLDTYVYEISYIASILELFQGDNGEGN